MSTFKDDLEFGKIAEEVVFNILKRYRKDNIISAVFDKRSNKEAQAQDYDFSFRDYENILTMQYAEVKHDTRIGNTNNLFIEHTATMKRDGQIKDGWLHYSIADYIYYVDQQREIVFVFSLDDIKDFIQRFRPRTGNCYDSNKTMTGYLINVKQFAKHYPLQVLDYVGDIYDTQELLQAI